MNGYVKNFSKVTIRHTKIVLLETIQYLSRGKIIQTEKRELAQIKFPKIRPGSRDEFVNKKLYVPPLPPTNIRNSNIIRLNYDVYVSLCLLRAINLNIFGSPSISSEKYFLKGFFFLSSVRTPKKYFSLVKTDKNFHDIILFYLVTLIWTRRD